MKNLSFFLCLALVVFVGARDSAPTNNPKVELDTKIIAAMNNWSVPGLAVVVVKGDKTVLIKGYGTRTLGTSQSISPETYLQIASNSKMFTAYSIGMLVDEGRLNWHDPVIKYIPELSLPDPTITKAVAIDDLLCHRSGLTEWALGGFKNPDYTIESLLGELQNSELSTRFRAQNNYSQVGMALLGEVVKRVSGQTWGSFVRTHIFDPLKMESTYSSNDDFTKNIGDPSGVDDIMNPTVKRDGRVLMGSWQDVGTEALYAPAGGIISNMEDMSAWIQFRLNNGWVNNERFISSEALTEIRKPRIPADFSTMNMPWSYFHPSAQLIDVGFGHYSFEHQGRRIITHNGGWMSSVIAIMPTEDIGVGIFSNAWFDEPVPWASLAFVNALALEIFDYYLGYKESDWTNQMANILETREKGN